MNFRIFDPIRIIYEKTYIHYCRRWICQYRGRNSFDHFPSIFCAEDRHLHTSSLIEQDMQGAQGLLGQEIFPTCNASSSSGSRLCFSVSYRSRREPDHQFRFYIWLIFLREWRDVSTFAPLELSTRMGLTFNLSSRYACWRCNWNKANDIWTRGNQPAPEDSEAYILCGFLLIVIVRVRVYDVNNRGRGSAATTSTFPTRLHNFRN